MKIPVRHTLEIFLGQTVCFLYCQFREEALDVNQLLVLDGALRVTKIRVVVFSETG